MRKHALTVIALAALIVPAASSAAVPRHAELVKYSNLYHAVANVHGKRAPGRNIRRHGVKRPGHHSHRATAREIAKSIRSLRVLRMPYLVPSAPSIPPAGIASAAPSGLAGCIVSRESGGDPGAANGEHLGIAQWSPIIWARDGGLAYASSPTGATYQEQLVVLSNGLSHYGCGDWCPYDNCG